MRKSLAELTPRTPSRCSRRAAWVASRAPDCTELTVAGEPRVRILLPPATSQVNSCPSAFEGGRSVLGAYATSSLLRFSASPITPAIAPMNNIGRLRATVTTATRRALNVIITY
jgi:hypothetical protein